MADVDTTRTSSGDDWAVQTADTIERLVESVRSNTSDRLVSVARLVVFGLLAAILGTIALVLLAACVQSGNCCIDTDSASSEGGELVPSVVVRTVYRVAAYGVPAPPGGESMKSKRVLPFQVAV